jgi:hypothetical protein
MKYKLKKNSVTYMNKKTTIILKATDNLLFIDFFLQPEIT